MNSGLDTRGSVIRGVGIGRATTVGPVLRMPEPVADPVVGKQPSDTQRLTLLGTGGAGQDAGSNTDGRGNGTHDFP